MADTFCVLPWMHLATHPHGGVTLCCVSDFTGNINAARNDVDGKKVALNLNRDSIEDIVNADSFKQARREMLAGKAPPPTPEELRLRPMDVSAVLDGIAAGTLAGVQGIQLQSTVVVGHSWGGITALQLAGGRSSSAQLRQNCGDLLNPERTLSWILQCSFVSTADAPPQPDLRVRSVVAVSPPIGLLFSPEAVQGIQARVLLVSGSHDWVVSPDPEALLPFSQSPAMGHRLVLVKGGDHFNMRAPEKAISVAQSMALKKHVTPAKAAPAAVL